MMHKTLRLIYHMWIPSTLYENIQYKYMYDVHYKCLQNFISVFNEVLFVLSIDDINDTSLAIEVENDLLNLGYRGNLQFKIVENDPEYREGRTFYNEIVKKLNNLDGLTFFAHSKGFTNFEKSNKDNIKEWVEYMYYSNLAHMEDVKESLNNNPHICYGALMTYSKWSHIKYQWAYLGSFQWINCKKLYNYITIDNISLPPNEDRMIAEDFLGSVLKQNLSEGYVDYMSSYKNMFLTETFCGGINCYQNVDDLIRLVSDEKEYNNFIDFCKKIEV